MTNKPEIVTPPNVSTLPTLAIDFNILYYVSGPMSNIEDHNWPAFDKAVLELRTFGLKIISPHEIAATDGNPKGSLPWQEYVRADLIPLIRDARGIIMLRGWTASKGARCELNIALDLAYPTYYYDNQCLIDMNRWEGLTP